MSGKILKLLKIKYKQNQSQPDGAKQDQSQPHQQTSQHDHASAPKLVTPNHRFKHHHRHTPKHGTQHATKRQCNQKNKKYIGTLSSSQTTTAHPTTNPYNQSQRQAAETKLHTRKHKVKSNQTSQTRNRPQAATLFTLIIPSKRLGRSSATRDNLTTNQQTTQIACVTSVLVICSERPIRALNYMHGRIEDLRK